MLRAYLELAVVAAEPFDDGHHGGQVVHIGHDGADRAEQAVLLRGHRDREHVPQFGIGEEEPGVEEPRRLRAECADARPAGAQTTGVHYSAAAPDGAVTTCP